MTKKFLFPAGKYYIGDPCYAVKDEKWSDLIESTGCFGLEDRLETKYLNWDDGAFIYNGRKCFASGTVYGDGTYYDKQYREYGVDAGLLGIIPFESCDGDSMEGGNIVEFEKEFKVYESEGVFYFGNIKIDTDE